MRVYVAKRNPAKAHLGPLGRETDRSFVKKLIDSHVEVAYVDNGRAQVGKDATFWRFQVTGEVTSDGRPVRYLMRDVDHKLTSGEAFAVGEWIRSKRLFHRMHFNSLCVGPLTAGLFGGISNDQTQIRNIKFLTEKVSLSQWNMEMMSFLPNMFFGLV